MTTKLLSRGLLLRILTVALLAIPFAIPLSAAQQTIPDAATSDKTDAIAFRSLFRRAAVYKKISDNAEAAHQDRSYFRRILGVRFALSDDDAAKLETISIDCQNEIIPLHTRALSVIAEFRARFPGGIAQPGVDKSPPPELSTLQVEEDSVVLRYRDLLRNEMGEEAFQKLVDKVRNGLGTAFPATQPRSLKPTEGAK